MKQLFLFLVFFASVVSGFAQPVSGTTGLLNIPTAEMQRDGTFTFGANYLPQGFTPSTFNYNTGNYYFNITFVPFLEVTYRLTLFQSGLSGGKYTEQDRSFGIRARLWKEGKIVPAFVVGGNDLYTSTDGGGNQYFGSTYAVASKSIRWNEHRLLLTAGSGLKLIRQKQLSGPFGGISYTPGFLKQVSLMADYDARSINLGASALLFNHLHLHAFVNDFDNIVAGFGYRIYLKKRKD